MPTKSKKQAAYNKDFASKVGIPVGVGKEFVAADRAAGKVKTKRKK